MPEIDEDLVTLVKELAAAVAELPESLQQRAFDLLVERHIRLSPPGGPAREDAGSMGVDLPEVTGDDWRATLAREAGVREEQIAALLDRDGEEIYVVTPELGETGASRTRNIAVLVLWASRVLSKDIYAPQSLVYGALGRLNLPRQNVTNNLKAESCVKALQVSGQRMFQLVGDWRDRAVDIIKAFADS